MQTQEQFVARRRAVWNGLDQLLATARSRGAGSMSLEDLRRLGELYRLAAGDLAYARTFYPHSQVTVYLNGLVARAHTVVYAPAPRNLRNLWHQVAHGIPAAVRRAWRPLALAIVLLALPALAGAVLTYVDEPLGRSLLPDAMQEITPQEMDQDPFAVEERPVISTFIFINNARVSVLAFGLGITAGIGTAYILAYNGLTLGVLAALFHKYHVALGFWTLILPHGLLELLSIALAGASGLLLGGAIIDPGRLPRSVALSQRMRSSLPLLLAAVMYLVFAAAIEGFFTPILALPPWFKLSIGVVAGFAAIVHWLTGGSQQTSG